VHGRQIARKVVSKGLEARLGSPVHRYGSCEDALRYTEHYDTFVVYNNFGKRMNGANGVAEIRAMKPEALIIGVTSVPGFRHKFAAAGADETVLLSGNEVAELVARIKKYQVEGQEGRGQGAS
jgi:DNA-binding LytR/AlgR family response regulator